MPFFCLFTIFSYMHELLSISNANTPCSAAWPSRLHFHRCVFHVRSSSVLQLISCQSHSIPPNRNCDGRGFKMGVTAFDSSRHLRMHHALACEAHYTPRTRGFTASVGVYQ
jgi:hypothetical protein